MKVIGDHVYIGSEASNHGLQIFDLKKLLTVTSPKVFSISSDLTARFSGFGSSHNIVANEDTKMIYAVGTSRSAKCRGGLWMVDVSNPASPKVRRPCHDCHNCDFTLLANTFFSFSRHRTPAVSPRMATFTMPSVSSTRAR